MIRRRRDPKKKKKKHRAKPPKQDPWGSPRLANQTCGWFSRQPILVSQGRRKSVGKAVGQPWSEKHEEDRALPNGRETRSSTRRRPMARLERVSLWALTTKVHKATRKMVRNTPWGRGPLFRGNSTGTHQHQAFGRIGKRPIYFYRCSIDKDARSYKRGLERTV